MTISSAERKQLQDTILDRYEVNKRDLPWRKTSDPYKIMVSEVMLQQTQVPRVIMKFNEWMERRPTVRDIAKVERAEILRAWSGLGFNRRAINLHEACKKLASDSRSVVEDHTTGDSQENHRQKNKNERPVSQLKQLMSDYKYLISLPGIGDYTANAVLAFGYNYEVPVLDINIKRVLMHSFDLPKEISVFDLQTIALSMVPVGRSREWHNALMDYGSAVLHSKATGIQSAKQSTFVGSDRQVRGWILKQLSAHHKLTLSDVISQFPDKDGERIVNGLVQEGMIVIGKKGISFA